MSWYSFKQLCERTEVMLRNQLPNNQIENIQINGDESVATTITKTETDERTEIDDDLIDDIDIIHKLVENNVSVRIPTISNCASYRLFRIALFRMKSTALMTTKIQNMLAINTLVINLTTRPSHHLRSQKRAIAVTLQNRKIYFPVTPAQWLSEKSNAWKHTNERTVA